MSDSKTIRMIRAYFEQAAPVMFLTGLFESPAENYHNSEEVEIDIERTDEDVAIVLQDPSTGYRVNSDDIYTNKGFKPPVFKEAFGVNSFDLLKREPGVNPFEDNSFRANLIVRIFKGMRKVEAKIRRAIELQASQVLQTGTVTLKDANGVDLFVLNYSPKATHFPTVGTAWDQPGADPINDIMALANVIRNDGLHEPDQLLMGESSFEAFIKNEEVQARFDNRRIDLGTISPMTMRGNGGQYRGIVEIGNYRYDVWTYGGRYKDPQTGNVVKFINDDSCVVRASTGRLDATFGTIPNIGSMLGVNGPQLLPELPARMSGDEQAIDLFTNAWLTDDGEQLLAGVGARPLMIPTAIDTFGCLNTGV